MSTPTFASLFCGCGGLDLGFIEAHFRCIGAFDIDKAAVQEHRNNLSSCAAVLDLSCSNSDLSALAGADVIVAGPPCQGFSVAGKRRFDDPRNELLVTTGQVALHYRPKVLVVENVTGVRQGSHQDYWQDLINMLRSGGFKTAEIVCDARDFGLAQMRRRVILFAWRSDKVPLVAKNKARTVSLQDALAGVATIEDHNPRFLNSSSDDGRIARRIAPGQKLSNVRKGTRSVHTWSIPEVFGHVSQDEVEILDCLLTLRRRLRLRSYGDADPVLASDVTKYMGFPCRQALETLVEKKYVRKKAHRYDLTNTFNGRFKRLTWDGNSYTVDSHFTKPRYFLHPDQDRGFTTREAMRLQGFPDSFRLNCNEQDQIRLIGNAVPPPMAKSLAETARNLMSGG